MEIHHIGYLVTDIKKSEKQFISCGYETEQETMYDPLRDADIEFLLNGDYRVELIAPRKQSDLYRLLSRFKNAPYHICYLVDDLEQAIEEYKSMHFVVADPPMEAPCIEGRRVTFLKTSGMGMIVLLEKEKPVI